eukprot:NODE_3621_length_2009_cov_5.791711.p1 GENE.NODE_3621_length_2009_cov_5.791711~~NODE_3621_length_2009_cov_5.791711.p1  ORF type:complete len:475 (+),score=91.54 NODE_3621_length_2009_cov_5.791711:268-1692(+)
MLGRARFREAERLLKDMRERGAQVHINFYQVVIYACARKEWWEQALRFHAAAQSAGFKSNVAVYTSLATACAWGRRWQRALDLLTEATGRRLEQGAWSYGAALRACERGAHWHLALEVLRTMREHAVEPTTATCTVAVGACDAGTRWAAALRIFGAMAAMAATARLEPDLFVCSSTLHACGRGSQWEIAVALLGSLRQTPSVVNYSAALRACSQSERWAEAIRLLFAALRHGRAPTVATAGAVAEACEVALCAEQLPALWRLMRRYAAAPLDHRYERKVTYSEVVQTGNALEGVAGLSTAIARLHSRRALRPALSALAMLRHPCPAAEALRGMPCGTRCGIHGPAYVDADGADADKLRSEQMARALRGAHTLRDLRLESLRSLGTHVSRSAVQWLGVAADGAAPPRRMRASAHTVLFAATGVGTTKPAMHSLVVWTSCELQSGRHPDAWVVSHSGPICGAAITSKFLRRRVPVR